jgi:hypothetical protein
MYLAYKLGAAPFFNVILLVVTTLLLRIYQIYLMHTLVSFNCIKYIKESVLPVMCSLAIILLPFVVLKQLLSLDTYGTIILILLNVLWAIIIIISVGLKSYERVKVFSFMKKLLMKEAE